MIPMLDESLISAAKLASDNAKAIKSGIKVGCALQVEQGERGDILVVQGCNIESHGADNVHAEVNAVCSAVSQGIQLHDITKLYLWFPLEAQPPCGCCLQFLASHFKDDFELVCAGPDRTIRTTLGEALPFAYRRKDNQ